MLSWWLGPRSSPHSERFFRGDTTVSFSLTGLELSHRLTGRREGDRGREGEREGERRGTDSGRKKNNNPKARILFTHSVIAPHPDNTRMTRHERPLLLLDEKKAVYLHIYIYI